MLDFYLGTGGIEKLGKYLGGISIDGIYWLQQNDLIEKGTTGHLPEDAPESFPYFDDIILSPTQVEHVYVRFREKAKDIRRTPGFHYDEMDVFEAILYEAVKSNIGLSTLAD